MATVLHAAGFSLMNMSLWSHGVIVIVLSRQRKDRSTASLGYLMATAILWLKTHGSDYSC